MAGSVTVYAGEASTGDNEACLRPGPQVAIRAPGLPPRVGMINQRAGLLSIAISTNLKEVLLLSVPVELK